MVDELCNSCHEVFMAFITEHPDERRDSKTFHARRDSSVNCFAVE